MRTFVVNIKAYKTVIVENCEDEDDALEAAREGLTSFHGFEIDEVSTEKELTDPVEIERYKRHNRRDIIDAKDVL